MKNKIGIFGILSIVLFAALNACAPIKEIHRNDPYQGPKFESTKLVLDKHRQTVVILASNQGTEIFDLMAPYEIFCRTGKLNVVVVAPERKGLPLWKGLYLVPHLSMSEFDEMKVMPDMIVVPNMVDPDNPVIKEWILKHERQSQFVLTVCEGSRVIPYTGLFEGSQITSHHSSIDNIEKEFPNYDWIRGQKVIEDGKLLSTSGVSAAVEGALLGVEKLLGSHEMNIVMQQIHYPSDNIQMPVYNSKMGFGDVVRIVGKTGFTKNKRIGVLLPDQVSEIEVAAIIDSYNRTFPLRLESFSNSPQTLQSKHGLVLIASSSYNPMQFDQILVPATGNEQFKTSEWINKYEENAEVTTFQMTEEYIFHQIYQRLNADFSKRFVRTVFRLLDHDIERELAN